MACSSPIGVLNQIRFNLFAIGESSVDATVKWNNIKEKLLFNVQTWLLRISTENVTLKGISTSVARENRFNAILIALRQWRTQLLYYQRQNHNVRSIQYEIIIPQTGATAHRFKFNFHVWHFSLHLRPNRIQFNHRFAYKTHTKCIQSSYGEADSQFLFIPHSPVHEHTHTHTHFVGRFNTFVLLWSVVCDMFDGGSQCRRWRQFNRGRGWCYDCHAIHYCTVSATTRTHTRTRCVYVCVCCCRQHLALNIKRTLYDVDRRH